MSMSLDDLLKLRGVAIAFEYGPDGQPKGYRAKMDVTDDMIKMIAQFCGTVTMSFNTLAGAFSRLSGQPWVPQQGWTYSGGDWTVVLGAAGYRGVFVETAQADFDKLFAALVG